MRKLLEVLVYRNSPIFGSALSPMKSEQELPVPDTSARPTFANPEVFEMIACTLDGNETAEPPLLRFREPLKVEEPVTAKP
jgi:hypothetical protein